MNEGNAQVQSTEAQTQNAVVEPKVVQKFAEMKTNSEQPVQSTQQPKEIQEWYLADGVKGNGDKPDYFNDKKYKNLMEQAKATPGLEKKLGAFVGAPEQYDMKILQDAGLEVASDGIGGEFLSVAKKLNMSQEGFNEIMAMYAKDIQSRLPLDRTQIVSGLGEGGEETYSKVGQWLTNIGLSKDELSVVDQSIMTSSMIRVLDKIRTSSSGKTNAVPNAQAFSHNGDTKESLALERSQNIDKLLNDRNYAESFERRYFRVMSQG